MKKDKHIHKHGHTTRSEKIINAITSKSLK